MRKIELSEIEKTFIGIDVSKDTLEVFVDTSSKKIHCPNQTRELKRLARELKRLSPELIVMEATGGYETRAAVAFTEAGLPFAVVFPRRVRQLALGLGVIAKTDEIDARVDRLLRQNRRHRAETSRIQRVTLTCRPRHPPLPACRNAADGGEPARYISSVDAKNDQ